MNIIMAQLNYLVGDIEGNRDKILREYDKVKDQNALFICTELALTGYYPQDLATKLSVLKRQEEALSSLQNATLGRSCGIVVGFVDKSESNTGKRLHNALTVLHDGQRIFTYHKRLLPTYNVFDEARHFDSGNNNGVFEFEGKRIGVLICEDAWAETSSLKYAQNPVDELVKNELDLVVDINASPNNIGKMQQRIKVVSQVAKAVNAPVVYVNQVGGNDELVFDGASFIVNAQGERVFGLPAFSEDVDAVDLDKISQMAALDYNENTINLIYQQVVLGIRDYVVKCGFNQVVVGSSGGIDSAVTLAICVAALGKDNVTAITMPSRFSSEGSVTDSNQLCDNLGIRLLNAPIVDEFQVAVDGFKKMTGESPSSLTQENMQARIRGRILMEYSNHFGALVISTGNKSEMSVGYATLYGDMNGGVNPLGDLYKMEVYSLAKYINQLAGSAIIPLAIIDKAPSAELSEDQLDSDSLPDYPLLDAILKIYIEGDLLDKDECARCNAIIEQYKVTESEISRIRRMVDHAEFKRRQAPPIIRVQKRSFGKGRWLPVAAKY